MNVLTNLKNKKGFTVVEMIVVVLVIMILIAIAIPAVAGYRADANETADRGSAETVYNAFEAASTKFTPTEPDNLVGAVNSGLIKRVNNRQEAFTQIPITQEILVTNANPGPLLETAGELLGDNFTGHFTFSLNMETGDVNWVTYRREGEENAYENIMLYDVEKNEKGYLSDLFGGDKERNQYIDLTAP